MEPLRPRKSRRSLAGVAALAGVVFLAFEIHHWPHASPEKWFWAFVAILMIVLGTVGLFDRGDRRT